MAHPTLHQVFRRLVPLVSMTYSGRLNPLLLLKEHHIPFSAYLRHGQQRQSWNGLYKYRERQIEQPPTLITQVSRLLILTCILLPHSTCLPSQKMVKCLVDPGIRVIRNKQRWSMQSVNVMMSSRYEVFIHPRTYIEVFTSQLRCKNSAKAK
jgi:hypothetical protein